MNKKLIDNNCVDNCSMCNCRYSSLFLFEAPPASPQTPTGELNLTVNGSSSCLRFLNDSVPMVYVPFTVAANQQMQLTINATKMPGATAYTEIYVYNGYWNKGENNTCRSARCLSNY